MRASCSRAASRPAICTPARSRASCARSIPAIAVSGLGGPQFAAAGGTLLDDYRGLSVTGLTEALSEASAVVRGASRGWSAAARANRPDALVVIDFPDFNFRLARRDQGARHPGRLLHQPADLGVAPEAAQDDPKASPISCS